MMPNRTPALGLLLLAACPVPMNIGDPIDEPATSTDQNTTTTAGETSSPTTTGTSDEMVSTSQGINETEVSGTTTADMTSADTTGSTGADTSTGAPPETECTPAGDGLESGECLAIDPNRPFCQEGTCVGCGALAADACTTATAGDRPICLPGGACVQCDSSDALALGQCPAEQPHCNLETNACEGCFEHSECPETACEIAVRTCFPENKKIYVRQGPTAGSPCSSTPGMGGTMFLPYCDFETATLGVQENGFSSGYTFHLMGNDDAPGDPGAVVITGGDAKVAYAFTHDFGGLLDKHTRFKGIGPLILVPKNVTLYLVNWGVIIDKPQGDTSRGIDCQEGGSVWLDDSRVMYAKGPGIRGTGCDIHLRRTSVAFGQTEAIDMTGGSLHAVNSFITGNANIVGKGGGGLHLRDGATVDMVYSTIADNSNEPSQMPGQFGDSIHCDNTASVKIRNSIIVRKPANNNFSIVCPEGQVKVDWSVVDSSLDGNNPKFAAEDLLKALAPSNLTGVYRIISQAAGEQYFSTAAKWQPGDPQDDFDLETRNAVPDGDDYAGADVFPTAP